MKTFTDIITKYINNELSESDKARFEKELAGNAELKKEYELQLQLIEGVKRMGLKNQVSSAFKKTKTHQLIKKAVIGLAVAITAAGAVLFVKNAIHKPANNILYELNEQGNKNWAEADRALEAQVFTLNPLRDTILETQKGIVISVPAGSFLNKFGEIPEGPIDLEVKEAMTASDIMKAGLSTMSNGKLLETGGMFYINARDGEENLSINQSKPLNANVPVNNTKKDMMLFKGERKADGSINWIDPKPMRKRLTTVDMTGLDFYPEHFLDSLKEMGFDVKNKKLTDSIYYSFSGYCHFNKPEAPAYDDESEGGEYSFDEAIESHEGGNGHLQPSPGEKLFKQNCAMCHTMTSQKLTGPGLAGILGRVPGGDWLGRYILNSEKVLKSGDPYATKIYIENGKAAMPVYEGSLNENELNTLIKYITGKEAWNTSDLYDGSEGCVEINPSRVKAIWDKQFNHTILATKEFEERLKVIFKTCDAGILNLYIKNLNQDLYVMDSMAASRLGGELKNTFLGFYSRRDGCVDISDRQSQKLQKYFDEKRAVYAKAVNKALEKMYEDETKKSQIASEEYIKHINNETLRNSKVFTEELQLNMDEAYRQLGAQKLSIPPPTYLSAPITQTGWNNVDKYVFESTANRSTLDYTDPQSGKKAVIRYEPISITVTNSQDYDKVMSYMIPDKLSSFQLMKKEGNLFKENLNELMKYSVVTVGFKGNSAYYHTIENAKAQAYTIELASIKQGDLDKKLNGSFGLNGDTDFAKEINYQLFETKEAARKLKIKQREEVQRRLTPVVFPCSRPAAQADTALYEQ